jgi:hypothetical protein
MTLSSLSVLFLIFRALAIIIVPLYLECWRLLCGSSQVNGVERRARNFRL